MKYIPFNDDFENLADAIMAAAALTTYFYLFKFYERRKIAELSRTYFWYNALGVFLIGFLVLSMIILVMCFANAYTILSFNPVSSLLPALAIGISSAIFEEILFRGIIFRITEEKLGSVWALIISSSIFGFGHLANENSTVFSAIAIIVEAGLLLGGAYIYSKNLWLPIFIHFAWNFAEGGIYGAVISRNDLKKSLISSKISGPDLFTGGAFDPENSLQAIFMGLAVGILFLWFSYKQHKIVKPFRHNQKIKE